MWLIGDISQCQAMGGGGYKITTRGTSLEELRPSVTMPDMEINMITLGGNLDLREHLSPRGTCWCNSDR